MNTKTFILILLVIILSFGAAFLYFNNFMAKPKDIKYYNYSPGNEFVTNLKDDNKFVKAVIELQVNDKNTLKDLQDQNAKIRDLIIQILRSKTPNDVDGPQGQLKLQNDIKNEINKAIGPGKVINVYFDEFIVQ